MTNLVRESSEKLFNIPKGSPAGLVTKLIILSFTSLKTGYLEEIILFVSRNVLMRRRQVFPVLRVTLKQVRDVLVLRFTRHYHVRTLNFFYWVFVSFQEILLTNFDTFPWLFVQISRSRSRISIRSNGWFARNVVDDFGCGRNCACYWVYFWVIFNWMLGLCISF